MLQRDVAPGIHRINDAFTNWYLVEDDDGVTIVDCGVPTSWDSFLSAMSDIGRTRDEVRAVILTHAHFDHIGFAERARTELRVPVHVHTNDVPLTRKPLQYAHEGSLLRMGIYPRNLPIAATLLANRAWWPKRIGEVRRMDDVAPSVPGAPKLVFTPGHTLGHCAFHFPDRDAVIVGDAIVTLDPYTARTGPRLVAKAATADVERARESLSALEETGARIVLGGHGEPWTDGVGAAVARARVEPVG